MLLQFLFIALKIVLHLDKTCSCVFVFNQECDLLLVLAPVMQRWKSAVFLLKAENFVKRLL